MNLREILATSNIEKERGPDGIAPFFFRRTSAAMNEILHSISENVKRLLKMSMIGKIAIVSFFVRKRYRRQVES